MDNNLCTKNIITQNNKYETKYLYSYPNSCVKIHTGGRFFIDILGHKYGNKIVDLICNSIVIFELNDEDYEFIPERIFENIAIEIGGIQIDKINMNYITILQKKYNLEIKKIGSKVFFPIPINCLLKSNGIITSKCMNHGIRLFFSIFR